MEPWIFSPHTPGSFDLIMADPAWTFRAYSNKGLKKSAQNHYACMTIDEIAELPVASLAAPNCLLWLWATAPMLDQQIRVMEHWGFNFKSHGAWVKTSKAPSGLAFGTGYLLRNCHETFLIGTIGSPKTTRGVRSIIKEPRREHSRKPESAYQAAEQLIPDAKRIELFARTQRPGWSAWGDEVDKFGEKSCKEMVHDSTQ